MLARKGTPHLDRDATKTKAPIRARRIERPLCGRLSCFAKQPEMGLHSGQLALLVLDRDETHHVRGGLVDQQVAVARGSHVP